MAKKHKKHGKKSSLTKKLLIATASVVLLGGVAAGVAVPLVLSNQNKDTGIKINVPDFGNTIQAYYYIDNIQESHVKLSYTLNDKYKAKEIVWEKVSGSNKISIDASSGVVTWTPFTKADGNDIKFKVKAYAKDNKSISDSLSLTLHLNESKMGIFSTNFGDDDTIFAKYGEGSSESNEIHLETIFKPIPSSNLLMSSSDDDSGDISWSLDDSQSSLKNKVHIDPNTGIVNWTAVNPGDIPDSGYTITFKVTATSKSNPSNTFTRDYTLQFGKPIPYEGDDSWLTISDTGVLSGTTNKWDPSKLNQYDTLLIPTNVTSIGSDAFSGKIKSSDQSPNKIHLFFGAGSHCAKIGGGAFNECDGLVGTIHFPATCKNIGNFVFHLCSNIEKVDYSKSKSINKIGLSSYEKCTKLNQIIFPSSLTSIEKEAFTGCSSLTNLDFPSGLTTIGNTTYGSFFGCTSVTTFDVSKCYNLKNVNKEIIFSLNESAFNTETIDGEKIYYDKTWKYCFGVKQGPTGEADKTINGNVTIRQECKSIVDMAFQPEIINDNSHLVGAYQSKRFITGIDLSQCTNLKYIGYHCFYDNSKLMGNIVVPSTVEEIGLYAFSKIGISSCDMSECNKITGTVNDIDSPCTECQNLTSIKFPSSLVDMPYADNNPELTSVNFEDLINLRSISYNRFQNDTKLANVDLSNCLNLSSVWDISFPIEALTCDANDNGVYYDASHTFCFGSINQNKAPTGDLHINTNTKFIAGDAFAENCGSITSFSLEGCNNILSVGDTIFQYDATLDDSVFMKDDNGFYYDKAGIICFGTNYKGDDDRDPIITDNLSFLNTTKIINSYAFKGVTGKIDKISFPDSLISIGGYAFSKCSALSVSEITFPNNLKIIGANCFYDNSNLTATVKFPNSLISIGAGAFEECYELQGSIIIPDSVDRIEDGVFHGCKKLSSLSLGNGVKYIGRMSFNGCGFGGDIVFPKPLLSLSSNSFNGCANITGLDFSKCSNLTKLNQGIFTKCNSLTSLMLPPSDLYLSSNWLDNGNNIIDEASFPWTIEQLDQIEGISQIPDISVNGVVYIKKGVTKENIMAAFGEQLPESYKLPSIVWIASL